MWPCFPARMSAESSGVSLEGRSIRGETSLGLVQAALRGLLHVELRHLRDVALAFLYRDGGGGQPRLRRAGDSPQVHHGSRIGVQQEPEREGVDRVGVAAGVTIQFRREPANFLNRQSVEQNSRSIRAGDGGDSGWRKHLLE